MRPSIAGFGGRRILCISNCLARIISIPEPMSGQSLNTNYFAVASSQPRTLLNRTADLEPEPNCG